jgi:ribosomal protein S18 acetylase RimI-like enzyme
MGGYMNFIIREMGESEYAVLDDFLYEAIFIPEGVSSPSREIIYQPELQVYVDGFGTIDGDYAFVADLNGKIVGAVWTRIMNDYGHIDNDTPSFAISLYKEYRNKGIGTALMKTMLNRLKKAGYRKASLAVQKENYAVKMYKNVGFTVVDENDTEYIMLCEL